MSCRNGLKGRDQTKLLQNKTIFPWRRNNVYNTTAEVIICFFSFIHFVMWVCVCVCVFFTIYMTVLFCSGFCVASVQRMWLCVLSPLWPQLVFLIFIGFMVFVPIVFMMLTRFKSSFRWELHAVLMGTICSLVSMWGNWLHTSQANIAGVVNHWLAPFSGPFFGDWLDPKLVNCIGL